MLVLARRFGESIVLFTENGEIEFTINHHGSGDKGQVSITFDAPDSVKIWRAELLEPRPLPDES